MDDDHKFSTWFNEELNLLNSIPTFVHVLLMFGGIVFGLGIGIAIKIYLV